MSPPALSAPRKGERPVQVGRYLLAAKLASGGMSSVHVGRLMGAAGFGRTVAVKQLHPHLASEREFVAMLLDEARLASRIRHPNVVSVSDVVQQDGQLLLVMDYVPGVSLAELIKLAEYEQRRLPLPIVSAIGCGILHGLHAAHEATDERGRALGIVHRDVSPQNILVGSDGVARLVDFGVAKAVGRLNTTVNGQVKGKMAYMAPEQLRSGAVDRRADVYAAALVLWEAITLVRPFDGDDAPFKRIAGDVPAPSSEAPGIPASVDEVLARALQRAPEHRTPDARAMAQELQAAVPPATDAEVAALVAELAAGVLEERAAMVTGAEVGAPSGEEQASIAIEQATAAASGPTPIAAAPVSASAEVAVAGGSGSGPVPPAQDAVPPSGAMPPPADALPLAPSGSPPSALAPAAGSEGWSGPFARPPRSRAPVVAAAAVGVLVAAVVGYLFARGPRGTPPPAAASARLEAPAAPRKAPAPPPVSPPEIPAAERPAPPASPGPVAAAVTGGARPTHPGSHKRPGRSRGGRHRKHAAAARAERPAGASSSSSCVPPFTIGPDGVKQYKIECL